MVTSSPNWYRLHLINVSESINQVNYGLAPSPILLIILLGTMSGIKTEKTTIKRRREKEMIMCCYRWPIWKKKKNTNKDTLTLNCYSFPIKYSFESHLCLSKENCVVLILEKVKLMSIHIYIYLKKSYEIAVKRKSQGNSERSCD